jgi:hypothetical protein
MLFLSNMLLILINESFQALVARNKKNGSIIISTFAMSIQYLKENPKGCVCSQIIFEANRGSSETGLPMQYRYILKCKSGPVNAIAL